MRLEQDLLTDRDKEKLGRFAHEINAWVTDAVKAALQRGELPAGAIGWG